MRTRKIEGVVEAECIFRKSRAYVRILPVQNNNAPL